MKKIYDYIIYCLLAAILVVTIILVLPKKDNSGGETYTLSILTKSLEIDKSGSKKIEAESNGEILYRSYNPLIAVVTKEGVVIAISKGETKIEVSTIDSRIK